MISQTLAVFLWMMVAAGSPSERTRIWLDVPFVSQAKNGCGVACVTMVLGYWAGQRGSPPPDGSGVGTVLPIAGGSSGTLASQMKRYFENLGFRTYVFAAELEDLNHHLASGRPLIVCLENDALHYVVVAGIDPGNDTVVVNDPARRKLTQIDRPSFEKSWNRCKNWTLLALPPE